MENVTYPVRESYRYFAFISYSHKDMAWATWLQKKLESYRLPTQLRKKYNGLPKKIGRVFRDKTDLTGAVLENALRQELENSQYLIVICSANSVNSGYVNKEVEYFLACGRQYRIIPFVVSGEPYSDDPWKECLPLSIRRITPALLGVDARGRDRRGAVLRLVATMLRLPADELIMRERKRNRFRKIAAAVAAVVLCVTLGWTLWYNTEHSAFYNAYAYCNEIPVGLYKLSKQQLSVSSQCYRITTRRNKVVRIETVNSAGTVINVLATNSTTEYPRMDFLYDDEGQLISVIQRDQTGVEVARKTLSYPSDGRIIVEFKSSSSGEAVSLSANVVSSLLGKSDNKSRINRQDNTYDANGRVVTSMYYWYNTYHPACDSNGVYGKTYAYNDAGQIVRISNLDQNGNLYDCRYGWATIELEYDSEGNWIREGYYAADGRAAIIQEGYHARKACYDENGNLTDMVYVDCEDQPCNRNDGISTQQVTYDARGFLLTQKSYNLQGAPVNDKSGIHERCQENDEYGHAIRIEQLDRFGEPVVNQMMGYAAMEMAYDRDGNVIAYRMYDADEQLLYVMKYTYENGQKTRLYFEDSEGEPFEYMGFYSNELEYDQFGNLYREGFYDTEGKLTLCEDGYAYRIQKYGEEGNVERIDYYGTDEQLCLNVNGYASTVCTYSDGLLTGATYFGVDGKPVLHVNGYHEARITYHDNGVMARMEFYDTSGKLTVTKNGYAAAEQDCDVYGNIIEIRYYGKDDQPMLYGGEYHKERFQFDASNNTIKTWYYGTTGSLILHPDGYAVREIDYDAYGNTVARRYYGAKNEPVLFKGKYHEIRYQRDAYKNLTYVAYYGTDKQLIAVDGYAVSETERDAYGNYLAIRYFGTKNEPILFNGEYHEERREHDERGNVIRITYYGTVGQIILRKGGYAIVEQDFDADGNLISKRYFDRSDAPVLFDKQYHEIRTEFDEQGGITRRAYYDTDGNLALTNDGYAVIVQDFDADGNLISRRYYGRSNEPVMFDEQCHEIRWTYDEQGNEISISLYDTEGNLLRQFDSTE